eukprot:287599-Rhodomonas_salina.5
MQSPYALSQECTWWGSEDGNVLSVATADGSVSSYLVTPATYLRACCAMPGTHTHRMVLCDCYAMSGAETALLAYARAVQRPGHRHIPYDATHMPCDPRYTCHAVLTCGADALAVPPVFAVDSGADFFYCDAWC